MRQKNKAERIFPFEDNYFFGYYGKSPWCKNEKYVLGTKVPFLDKHPSTKDKAEIVLKDVESGEIKKISESGTWSWQQGCMLQWLGPDFNSKIIFNDFDEKNKKFASRIIDIKSGKEEKVDFPIYAVSPYGKKALSLNFSRLDDLRKGYGYPGKEDEFKNQKTPEKDGIYLVDLEKNKSKLIISLAGLYKNNHIESMDKGKHWVDHIEVSPNGKRFSFFHRWEMEGELFHTRLYSCDFEGRELFMFPDSGFYSHITWKNDKELFGFASLSEKFGNIRKSAKSKKSFLKKIIPIYKKLVPKFVKRRMVPTGYWILKDRQTKDKHTKLNIKREDGHGTWDPTESYVVTDTYPDSKGYRKLLLYDHRKNKSKSLGKFYSIPDKKFLTKETEDFGNSAFRVDLHPRWNFQGGKICIDSVHEGKRNMYEITLKKD